LIFICVSHVFFYSVDVQSSLYYFSNMFENANNGLWNEYIVLPTNDLIVASLGFFVVLFSEYRDETGRISIKEKILKSKPLFWIVVICVIIILIATDLNNESGFIYTQF